MEKLIVAAIQVDGSFYDEETKYEELSEDIKNSGQWWYLHGELEEDVGYDKGLILNIKPEQLEKRLHLPDINLKGEYEVEVKGINKPCIGYFWIDSMKLGRGFVCYKDDSEGLEYAKRKFKEGC